MEHTPTEPDDDAATAGGGIEQPKQAKAQVTPRTPKDQSRAIARTVIDSLTARLLARARAKGGQLSVSDIEDMKGEFDRQAQALQEIFEQSFEVYVKARERAAWTQPRDYPFDRLVVQTFSSLFTEPPGPRSVSRRMLPGFFMAIGMMLGPDVVESYQERCRLIVTRLKAGNEDFQWEELYADPDAQRLILDAQVQLARQFLDMDRRRPWFVNIVNGHLTPPRDDAPEDERAWELTEEGFLRFLSRMLSGLRVTLREPDRRAQLIKRQGHEAIAEAEQVLAELP